MKLNVLRMYDDVKMPVYATDGSGCFDIFSHGVVDASIIGIQTETHSTGLKFEVPSGKVLMIYSRSGHGFNKDIRLANCVGVIDSDYRGELKVKLTCDDSDKGYVDVRVGERIAQGMLIDVEQVEFVDVSALSETARGEGGFGSTNGS
jgi:dUTP pyrophosphatase